VGRFRVLRTMKAARRSGLPLCRFRRCDEMRLRLLAGWSRVTCGAVGTVRHCVCTSVYVQCRDVPPSLVSLE
jgi:hypothetical protein